MLLVERNRKDEMVWRLIRVGLFVEKERSTDDMTGVLCSGVGREFLFEGHAEKHV